MMMMMHHIFFLLLATASVFFLAVSVVVVVVPSTSPTPSLRSSGNIPNTTTAVTNHIYRRKASTRIIGGSIAPSNRYTYYVSLRKVRSDGTTGSHFCGGVLIAPSVVFTAAHCVHANSKPIHVLIGRPNFYNNDDGQVIHVQREVVHPNFTRVNGKAPNYDFALLYLQTPVDSTTITTTTTNNNNNNDSIIQFLKLNQNPNIPKSGDKLTVMGHGYTKVNEFSISPQLKELDKFALTNDECRTMTTATASSSASGAWNDYIGMLTDQMLCAEDSQEDEIEEDSCNGDSGGPLVVKGDDNDENGGGSDDVMVGVVSWGYGCAISGYPGVYARVSDAYDWVQQEICNGEGVVDTMTLDNFGCSTEKAESESEVVELVVSETPSFRPSIAPTEAIPSVLPSVMPPETRTTTFPSALPTDSPTDIETFLSLPPTPVQEEVGGSGLGTSSPIASPTAESTSIPTEKSSIDITPAPTPAITEESTVITISPTPAPTATFSEIIPIPSLAPAIVATSPDFTSIPTPVGENRDASVYTSTKKPTSYLGTLIPTSLEEV